MQWLGMMGGLYGGFRGRDGGLAAMVAVSVQSRLEVGLPSITVNALGRINQQS